MRRFLLWLPLAAFALFCGALFRYGDEAPREGARPVRLVKEAAAFATIAGGLVLTIRLAQILYVTATTYSEQRVRSGNTFSPGLYGLVPLAVWMLGAYVVFRSQDEAVVAEVVESAPASE